MNGLPVELILQRFVNEETHTAFYYEDLDITDNSGQLGEDRRVMWNICNAYIGSGGAQLYHVAHFTGETYPLRSVISRLYINAECNTTFIK